MRYMQRLHVSEPTTTMGGNVPYAEGGDVSQFGPYRIHMFTIDTTGTYAGYGERVQYNQGVLNVTNTMNVKNAGLMDILIVGGGGGGAAMGGGGGAGGYQLLTNVSVRAGSIPIQIGGGGTSERSHDSNTQSAGGASIFDVGGLNHTSPGGGKGISWNYTFTAPNPTPTAAGASGGGGPGYGAGNYNGDGVHTPAGTGTPGFGHPGGRGHHGPWGHAGGGGGGASVKGFDYDAPNHGQRSSMPAPNGSGNRINLYPPASPYASFPTSQAGGNGLSNDMLGSVNHYAGGGGGGGHPSHAWLRTKGGLGGGGQGISVAFQNMVPLGNDTYHNSGQSGAKNTGGGGGGSTHSGHTNSFSGRGGPGVVIVRYRTR